STGSFSKQRAAISTGPPRSPRRTNSPFLVPTSTSVSAISPLLQVACQTWVPARRAPGDLVDTDWTSRERKTHRTASHSVEDVTGPAGMRHRSSGLLERQGPKQPDVGQAP